jgi:hypothetical protein
MNKPKKAIWYTVVSTGIVFTVLACSSTQAKNTVANYQGGKTADVTANKVNSKNIQLINKSKATKKAKRKISTDYPSPVFKGEKSGKKGKPSNYPSPNY